MDDAKIPKPFRIEPLCELPCSLARTEIVARPCVAFLHSDDSLQPDGGRPSPTVDEGMMPRLDAKEVAAVFSAPFHNFLTTRDEQQSPSPRSHGDSENGGGGGGGGGSGSSNEVAPPPGEWYDGYWSQWHGEPWRVHNFHVPVNNQKVTRPRRKKGEGEDAAAAALADELEEHEVQRFLVWGFTGRILVDTARVAYAEEPAFEHNAHYGDEAIITRLEVDGQLPEKKRRAEVGLEATREVVNETKI